MTFSMIAIIIVYERARFNRRNQLDCESTELYITDLHKFAESMKKEMIRDRLVVVCNIGIGLHHITLHYITSPAAKQLDFPACLLSYKVILLY